MKSRLNYKSKKTIIITVAIIALLVLSATGIYVFTKGNDNAQAFTEENIVATFENEEDVRIPVTEEQTVEQNIVLENNEEKIEIQQNQEERGTTTSIIGDVPNEEYVTERQEEVEKLVYEGFLVGWTSINLTEFTDDISLNKVKEEPSYTINKIATLVNGETILRDENGNIITKVKLGDKVTYVITVENTGNVTLQNIKVLDELVGYEETIVVLAIGDRKEITIEYVVNQEEMDENEEIVNTVKAVVPNPKNPEENIEEKDEEEVPVNPYIPVNGNKIWVDYDNQEKTRPESIIIEVLNGEAVVDTITVATQEGSIWSYTSKALPKYNSDNSVITYTVREKDINLKYTVEVSGTTITNTLKETPTTVVSGQKTWIDNNNKYNTRPDSITIKVLNNQNVVDTIVIKPEDKNNATWSYSSKKLPKYDENNKVINYTVEEDKVEKYTSNKIEGTNNFINTIEQEKNEISVTKKWIQEPEGVDIKTIRPTSLELQLKGKEIYTYTLTEEELALNEVTHKFIVDKYDLTDGSMINYTADENTDLKNYNKIVKGNVITNAYKYTKFTVTKTAYKDEQCTQEVDLNKKTDKFAAGETVYYKMTITNIGKIAGSADATDTLPPELENYEIISSLDGISANIKDGILAWSINNLSVGASQTVVIKATVKNDIKYVDMATKTGEETSVPVMLFIRKDKIIQNEDGSTHYNKGDYTSSLGTAYLKEGTAKSYGNLSGELINGLLKVNNEIVDKVQKGVSRKQIRENLANEGIELQDDEVIIWYVIKKEQDGWHIDGVIRRLEDLPRVTNKIDVVQRKNNEKVSDDAQIEITNVKVTDTTEITINKVWSDGNNQDGNRPENVKVQLYAESKAIGE